MMRDEPDHTRLLIAVALAALVLIVWQAFVEHPRRAKMIEYNQAQAQKKKALAATRAQTLSSAVESVAQTRAQRLSASARLPVVSDRLRGSIALKGARLDDLTLARYRERLDKDSSEVMLLSPAGGAETYFAEAGWVAADGKTKTPTADAVWQADKSRLVPGDPVTLRWQNGEGQRFEIEIAVDADYLFTLTQRVINQSDRAVRVHPYAFLNRAHQDASDPYAIMHEGPIGVMEGTLEELPYKALREQSPRVFERATGWVGVSDKYWLTAMIPQGEFKATFSHYIKDARDRYQVDYLGQAVEIGSGSAAQTTLRLFAGAKELTVIDRYAEGTAAGGGDPIALFDRAIDFGSLYFLTKPMLLLLTFFHSHISNFGINIMLLTIVVKLLMYPLASKSYHSMAQMREVQPEILKLRERYASEPMKMNQEMIAFYKREKINPASGCLPILIQLPVFFALYKVLFVSIEMRHAPFFGWIKDLSAPDPSNLFTLFGVLDWNAPSWLHLGVLPMVMCATMVWQMRLQPKPADPVQAKVMTYMPFLFLFLFASFPAGLVLYWAWSNVLSIGQQMLITRSHAKKHAAKKAKAV